MTATLNTSDATRDFVAMLPLSIRMRDHLRREKTGPIPGPGAVAGCVEMA